MAADKRVLFVCLGNICRSPLAEGVFRHLVAERGLADSVGVDSCGTAAYHTGEPPDDRSVAVAAKHGIDISDLRARQLCRQDFDEFDVIVVMDPSNLRNAERIQPPSSRAVLRELVSYLDGEHTEKEVPDPYYGGDRGFEKVYTMLRDAAPRILEHVQSL